MVSTKSWYKKKKSNSSIRPCSWLRGRRVILGQNVVFFHLRKVISRVWLITCQKIMSLRAREPPPPKKKKKKKGVGMHVL